MDSAFLDGHSVRRQIERDVVEAVGLLALGVAVLALETADVPLDDVELCVLWLWNLFKRRQCGKMSEPHVG